MTMTKFSGYGKLCISALLAATMLASCGTSSKVSGETAETTVPSVETEAPETSDPDITPDLETRDMEGRKLRIGTFENPNFHYSVASDGENGDLINDAIYRRNSQLEEKFDMTITQLLYKDGTSPKTSVIAGDDAYDLIIIRCPEALTWWKEGLLTPYSELPNIDLSKKYWDKSINDSLSIGNVQYIAEGAFNLDIYDLTFCLLFNKNLAGQYDLGDIYSDVTGGSWTCDLMSADMKAVTSDVNGDSVMDENDCYGYTAHPKMVAPGFWIAADTTSISKDEDDIPYINMSSERFTSVFAKIFEVVWDSEASCLLTGDQMDIPTECRTIFTAERSLFIDMSFFFIESMRGADTDFGIIPYPKYNEEQDGYHSRVCYYMPSVVPITCGDDDFVGYMLEMLNYESYNTVIPAYYDVSLKSKYSRDDESAEMLDIIFASRVIDIGDSTLCDVIRDGFIYTMMQKNDRNLASKLEKNEAVINKRLDVISEN